MVLDASVMANLVGDDGAHGTLARRRVGGEIHLAVLRKRWRAGDLTALPLDRFPTGPLMTCAYELRANGTPYDAAYVALAGYPLPG